MQPATLPAELLAAAPGIARRLATILAALAALVAHAFLRNPGRVGIIVALCTRINRMSARFARLMARLPAATATRAPRPSRSGQPGGPPPTSIPSARGWLVAELGYRAAGYGSQLNHLLNEPETVALLAQIPQVGRILRPVCRMLGIRPASIPNLRRPAARPARTPRASRPPPKGPLHHLPPGTPPPPMRPALPLCPRMHERWPWITLPIPQPA